MHTASVIRIAHLSDTHLELDQTPHDNGWGDQARSAGVDLVTLGGDIHRGTAGIEWAAREFAGLPVAYIAGNTEFHGYDHGMLIRDLRAAAARTDNVRFLENDRIDYDFDGRKLHLHGCTLWTDFALHATIGPDGEPNAGQVSEAQFHAARHMGDFEEISRSMGARFMPHHAAALHRQSRAWLDRSLDDIKKSDGKSALLFHHAVSRQSIPPWHDGDLLSPAFAVDMEDLITWYQPDLVLHGHTHYDVDYDLGHTRVFANQRGRPVGESMRTTPFTVQVIEIR